jgi:hypothetical protein
MIARRPLVDSSPAERLGKSNAAKQLQALRKIAEESSFGSTYLSGE